MKATFFRSFSALSGSYLVLFPCMYAEPLLTIVQSGSLAVTWPTFCSLVRVYSTNMPTRSTIVIESSSEGEDVVEFKEKSVKETSKKRTKSSRGIAEVDVASAKKLKKSPKPAQKSQLASSAKFVGSPLSSKEAASRWPEQYSPKKEQKKIEVDPDQSKDAEGEEAKRPAQAHAHYVKAEVDGTLFELGDCVYVHSGLEEDYIGRIIELFEDVDNFAWFTAQWFYRVKDTAIKVVEDVEQDIKRVYYSEVKDYNALDCLVSKIKIIRLSPLHHFSVPNPKPLPACDYYYDMGYDIAYSRFYILPPELEVGNDDSDLTNCNDMSAGTASSSQSENKVDQNEATSGDSKEYTLLDLYSGCGGMSTGLCMGAVLSNVKLSTKWALDLNPYACKSIQFNHPETQVRNESAEDFLKLIKEWKKLCDKYAKSEDVDDNKGRRGSRRTSLVVSDDEESEDNSNPTKPGEFEVEKIMGIRFTSDLKKPSIEMKVRWKGYGPGDDTWEPLDGLDSCEDCVSKFVVEGKRKKILPLPGDVDVVCGGPPCQGASGFNRFRNRENPLACERNKQIIVYMDIVNYLRPRHVLMENVVDILRFEKGILGRYALARLVAMHYQAMLGMMVAGCYGLPQFRMRVFLWGAAPTQKLPPYPLPTHDVFQKGGIPQEWERNMVAYDEETKPTLLRALTLGDALKDLPPVANSECRDEMSYGAGARTDFQRFIRLPKEVLTGASSFATCKKPKAILYDHHPLILNTDDYERVCHIPHKKGACFRDLPGVIVREDNTVAIDDTVERHLLPSGKPLCPDYAISFVKGRSLKPFARLWWDETVPTVVTRAEPHNQAILHPEQDRVLTIRENARLQGFPDYYKFFGPPKEKYIQVGNAVAVPVGRVLGYSLGMAIRHVALPGSLFVLPAEFPVSLMNSAHEITEIPLEPQETDDAAL